MNHISLEGGTDIYTNACIIALCHLGWYRTVYRMRVWVIDIDDEFSCLAKLAQFANTPMKIMALVNNVYHCEQ